jgi:hypothetical protein
MKTPDWTEVNDLRRQVIETLGESAATAAAARALRVASDHSGTPVADAEHTDTRALVDGALQQALVNEFRRLLRPN